MKRILELDSKGSVFVSTMVAMLLMLMTGGYLYSTSNEGLYKVKDIQSRTQAKYLAEAGLSHALATLKNSWSTSLTVSSTSLGPGTYSASAATIGGRTKVTGTGVVNGITQTATAEVSAPGVSALDYMFAAGGNADIDAGTGQSSGVITGDIYGGGNVILDGPTSGGVLAITGNVDSVGSITTGSNLVVTGTQTPSFSQSVAFPTVDFAYYQTIANTNGYYVNGNVTYASGAMPASPAGGVIYVNGNVTINGTQNSTACLVATGDITISKTGSTYPRVTIVRPVISGITYPAILSQGNITFTSTGNGGAYLNTTGIVYTQGNFTYTSGNHDELSIIGTLVAAGNIDVSPTAWSELTAAYNGETPPGFTLGVAEMSVESFNS